MNLNKTLAAFYMFENRLTFDKNGNEMLKIELTLITCNQAPYTTLYKSREVLSFKHQYVVCLYTLKDLTMFASDFVC